MSSMERTEKLDLAVVIEASRWWIENVVVTSGGCGSVQHFCSTTPSVHTKIPDDISIRVLDGTCD
jgi:hypothetical protein